MRWICLVGLLAGSAMAVIAEEVPGLVCRAALDGDLNLEPAGEAQPVAPQFVPGRGGAQALTSADPRQPAALLTLPDLDFRAGTLMLWYRPDVPGPDRHDLPNVVHQLVMPREGRGPGARVVHLPHSVAVQFPLLWKGDAEQLQEVFSHFVPGKWYHLAYTWDHEQGDLCQWVFGEPQVDIQNPDLSLPPLTERAPAYALGAAGASIADVRVYDRPLSGDEIRAAAGMTPGDCFYTEGRQRFDCRLELEDRKGELVLAEDFGAGWEERWVLEGPGKLQAVPAGLRMIADEGHIVLWNRQALPHDFIAEWDFTPQELGGLCIVFFCATGREGQSIFDPGMPTRDGLFTQYTMGEMNCYHISYARGAGHRAPNTALRKNWGFYRVQGGHDFIPLEAGVTSRLTLAKRGALIQFAINGQLSLNWVDDGQSMGGVWGAGHFGLRQMTGADVVYSNLRVWSVRD